jgi:hypothetical protein
VNSSDYSPNKLGRPRPIESGARRVAAAPWGWAAIIATLLSVVGYAFQTILDYVSLPDDVTPLVFFGFFEWDGILAFLTGIVAIWAGWTRCDWTFRFGVIAIAYVVLAQTIQTLWD